MARGFGTTVGSATTDRIDSALTTDPNTRSWFCWVNRVGDGGASAGRVFDRTATGFETITHAVFQRNFDGGTNGQWTFTGPATGSWVAFGVKYDKSATTNDPTVYVAGTKLTVGSGLTESATPSGNAISLSGVAYNIGNRASDGARNFDGSIAEFAIWDALLDDDEFGALSDGFSPALVRPASLVEYIPMVRDNGSRKLAAPTITGTAVQPHPRIILPRRMV